MTAATPILFGLLLTVGQTETPVRNVPSATPTEGTAVDQISYPPTEEAVSDAPASSTPTESVAPEETPSQEEATEESYLEELRQEIAAQKARYREERKRKRARERRDPQPGAPDAATPGDDLDVIERRPPPAPPKLTGHWRLAATVGRHEVLASSIDWFGGELRAEVAASLERNLGDWVTMLPGIGARIGLAYTHRGRDFLRLDLTELEVGVTYQYPHHGLWDRFFPYARIDFVGGWAAVAASPDLKDDLFVPGFGTTLGVRIALPRLGNNARFFGVAEIAYQYRATVTPRLRAPSDIDEDEPLPGPPVPLGRVDLSAFVARFGVGLEM